jgi:predicted acylesterase/phospholipase RssA
VIGTDLAHTRMVVFPEDVKYYIDDDNPLKPEEFPIADAVRISAGFPYFFPPMKLRDGVTKKGGVMVDGGGAESERALRPALAAERLPAAVATQPVDGREARWSIPRRVRDGAGKLAPEAERDGPSRPRPGQAVAVAETAGGAGRGHGSGRVPTGRGA